jgi:hypothetical protein
MSQYTRFLAVGPHVFGFGNTPEEAIKVARRYGAPRGMRSKAFGVYHANNETWVDDYGRVGGLGPLVEGYKDWRDE